jgi:hypothetical protein
MGAAIRLIIISSQVLEAKTKLTVLSQVSKEVELTAVLQSQVADFNFDHFSKLSPRI